MKIHIIISGLCIFSGMQLSRGDRISELECKKFANIPQNPDIGEKAHLVWVTYQRPKTVIEIRGVLVSNDSVITVYHTGIDVHSATVRFDGENTIHIVATASKQDYYASGGVKHYITVLKLRNPIALDSLHRPACLVSDEDEFESDTANQILSRGRSSTKFQPVNILTGRNCWQIVKGKYVRSLLCTQAQNIEYHRATSRIGSPVYTKNPPENISTNYYIYGLLSFTVKDRDPSLYTAVGVKIGYHIDWLEYNVWGEEKTCGRRRINPYDSNAPSGSTYHGEFPWHVALFELEYNDWNYICAGLLLNHVTVLTAAHCVVNGKKVKDFNNLRVSIGDYNFDCLSRYNQERRVAGINIPDSYNDETKVDDIALIKFGKPLIFSDYVQPICLPTQDFHFPNDDAILLGRGPNGAFTEESVLVKSTFPIVNKQMCEQNSGSDISPFINDKNFCAGTLNTNECRGNSGGGLMVQVKDQWYLRGIVSIGIAPKEDTCDPNHYILFTNVTKFNDWIRSQY